MKIGGFAPKPLLFVPVPLAMGALLGLITLGVQAAEPTKRVEIVIKSKGSTELNGYTVTGNITQIIVRNEDTITHGINTSLFKPTTEVKMTGGSFAQGKGPHVYRVAPGKTMVLEFTPPHMGDNNSFMIWCDLHSSVKAEMVVVEVTGPEGG